MTDYASMTEAEREDYEERAAIMEYDGGLSREAAERAAWQIVMAKRVTTAPTPDPPTPD